MSRARPHLWCKRGNSLVPNDAASEEFLGSIVDGCVVRTNKPTQPRSLPFQGKYWATLALIVNATECCPSSDHLHDFLVKATGFVSAVTGADGRIVDTVRDSTAFDAMDEQEFQQYVRRAEQVLMERLQIDVEAIRDEAWSNEYTQPDEQEAA